MKKFLTAALVALTLLSAGAHAQTPPAGDPATEAAVRELLVSMKYRQTMIAAMQSMLKNMPTMILQMATNSVNANPNLSDEQKKAELAKAAERIPGALAGVQAILNDPTLIDDMITEIVPLYARHFTVDEIHQMAAFYATPVGTKMMAVMPQVMNEAMQLSQKVIMPRVAKQLEAATKAASAPK